MEIYKSTIKYDLVHGLHVASVDGHRIESVSSQMLYYLHVLCGFIGVIVDLGHAVA